MSRNGKPLERTMLSIHTGHEGFIYITI